MKVNAPKTKVLNFDLTWFNFERGFKHHKWENTLNNCVCPFIEQVQEFTYLGITSKISRKSIRRSFYFLRNLCNENLLEKLVFWVDLFSSCLYGTEFRGGAFSSLTKKLFISQKYCIRMILLKLKENTLNIFLSNTLTVKDLFIFKVLILLIDTGPT